MDDLTLVTVIAVALFFDFTNGFHDTANSIATSVSTRALSPRVAVFTAAVLNIAGAFVAFTHGTNDAQKTMGIMALALVASGHLDPEFDRPPYWVIITAAVAMGAG